MGRTLTATLLDGASNTTYSYAGNNVTVTDEEIQVIFNAIKKLLEAPATPPKRRIGFKTDPR